MTKGTIVLEGGAARGIFTAGVLDYLMEQDVYFNNVIGVSAGSCSGTSYISRQVGRAKKTMIHEEYPFKYINMKKYIKTRSLMDMETLFEIIPNDIYPFDYETFFQSEMNLYIGVTNCITGEGEFLQVNEGEQELMTACRASSSLPLVAPMITIDGQQYLDGGLSDSIPLQKAIDLGEEKIILILTRQSDYSKKPNTTGMNRIYGRKYREYPELVKCLRRRYRQYNEVSERIAQLEAEGRIFVIRPEVKPVSRLEDDQKVMEEFYDHGYSVMKEKYQELIEYLEK